MPGFARGISSRSRGYPRVIQDPCTGAPHVALERADIDADLKTALDRQARQELERLLYVALTRAQHTLVLAHDHALFTGKKDLSKNAFAKLLGCGEKQPSAETFGKLPAALTTCAETAKAQSEKSSRRGPEQHVVPLAPALPGLTAAALSRATHFIKRNPSALAEAAHAEADPGAPAVALRHTAAGPNSGQLYGTWWHGFIERIDWRADAAAWDATFSTALPASPDPALSRHEWALLREELTTGTDLARLLTAPGVIAHAEMPFLWRMSESECLEGIIDLAVFDPAAGSWLILDWKTNRPSDAGSPPLRARYLPQLSAYWKAVSAMLGAPVAAGLYATAPGKWLPYETPALAAAWETLSRTPAAISQVLDPLS